MTDTMKKARKRKPQGPFPDEVLDQLLAQATGKGAKSLLGESGLIGQLKKHLAERMLAAKLTHHLASEAADDGPGNHRNSASSKRRLPGFDDHIISMYARGMTVREIQGHLAELYGLDVSSDLISTIADEVMGEMAEWQARPLEAMYPIIYFDALRLKVRDEDTVGNKAVYLALGIDGRKDVLGLWIEQTEGAKF